jgi:hypothetical protein
MQSVTGLLQQPATASAPVVVSQGYTPSSALIALKHVDFVYKTIEGMYI